MSKEQTGPATPKRVRPGAPLAQRLTRPGRMPTPIPEPVLATLALIQGLQSEAIGLLDKLNRSPVLFSGIVQLDATGAYTRTWDVAFACVSVANLSTSAVVTIAPGGSGDPASPPKIGPGVHQIPAGASGLFAVASTQISVYGPAGGYVDLGVATRWLPGF